MKHARAQTIKIGRKKVGYGHPTFIIAEAGVNHNGKLDVALRLVDAAAIAGADAVKFQTFKAAEVTTASVPMAAYQKKNIGKKQSQLEMLRPLELKEEYYEKIIKRCKKRGILFLSTPGSGFSSVDFLQRLGVKAFKIGSGDLANLPVLEYAAKFKKPMILGTGMSTLQEVKDAIQCIKKAGNDKIIALHCTTSYPCPLGDVNLAAMQTMMHELGVLVGYSDHTLGIHVPIMAAALGACVIEKHLTLDKQAEGPDHAASLEPEEFACMVSAIHETPAILGSSQKKPVVCEIPMIKNARKSLVTTAVIKKGERFTRTNIGIKRPGTGLPPRYYSVLLGKQAVKDIAADMLLTKKHYGK
ncbi:MAG: N-acetylneuraminate synthase [Parcubacteria group bacterium]|nr:N-acetylneuraminate synthase [Parcubacteria group bacterium]